MSEDVISSSVISSTLASFIDSAQLTNLVAKCYHLDLQRKLLEIYYVDLHSVLTENCERCIFMLYNVAM